MPISSFSDLAQSLHLRRDNATLRRSLFEATQELSTGKRANLVSHLGGDFSPLADIERTLKTTESYLVVVSEQRLRTDVAQDAFGTIRNTISETSASLLLVQTADSVLVQNAGLAALDRFESVVGTLNTAVGGTSLFSGVAADQPALATADTILDQLLADVAASGAGTADDVAAVVETWFSAGGGFDTIGYLGGTRANGDIKIGGGAAVRSLVTAEAPEIRQMLSALSLGALVGRGVLAAAPSEQASLAREAGLRLLSADEAVVHLQADLGLQQNRISLAEAENRARLESLEMHRSGLVGADPFDAATRLQETETQLESLYAMTARISRLTLTDYLR